MAKGIYVATSGSMAQLRHLETLSNNLANVRTAGFKGDRLTFEQVTAQDNGEALDLPDKTFVDVRERATDLGEGPLTRTDNPLDVALSGNAFLRVETERGVRLTRAGRMLLGRDGTLRTLTGLPVLDDRDRRIVLPTDKVPRIDENGAISTEGSGEFVRLGVTAVDMRQGLDKDPDGLFVPPATDAVPLPQNAVLQGFVEESNVSPVKMMLELIEVQRTFSALRQLITASGDMDQLAARLAQ
ncbi:MAG: flagellar hook-basal body protein [Deltaproteobacteria bacterium]|nr:flagellar hook-basal body protein [Deltaproteobacteria bacterium]